MSDNLNLDMNTDIIFGAIFIALSFTSWGIIAKYLNVPGHWASIIIIIGSFISAISFSISKIISEPLNNYKGLVILFTIGLINGFAVYRYGKYCVNQSVPTGIFVSMVVTLQLILAPFIDYIVNRNIPSIRQIIGVSLAIIAVIIMKK
jgi:drug/metabolite transporter (DMT)-like permease